MLGLGDLLTAGWSGRRRWLQIILNNESLDFVNIEMQEAGVVPFGVAFKNPNFAKVAEAMGGEGHPHRGSGRREGSAGRGAGA